MTVRLSAPSKTFMAGEYAVLAGGPALILNTQPRFELVAIHDSNASFAQGDVDGIPPGSPAWLWLEQRSPLLNGWRLKFNDPHAGAGGFGASGAQFTTVHNFTTLLQTDMQRGSSFEEAWSDYQALTSRSGSGADVLAQMAGGVARIEFRPVSAEAEQWPYPEIGFTLLRTNRKVATHEHLKTLDRGSVATLVGPARDVFESFDVDSAEVFLEKIDAYSRALQELKLQSPLTLEKVTLLEQNEWCLAAKGCGAWGADTILVFHPAVKQREVLQTAEALGLPLVATAFDLSSGMQVEREQDAR